MTGCLVSVYSTAVLPFHFSSFYRLFICKSPSSQYSCPLLVCIYFSFTFSPNVCFRDCCSYSCTELAQMPKQGQTHQHIMVSFPQCVPLLRHVSSLASCLTVRTSNLSFSKPYSFPNLLCRAHLVLIGIHFLSCFSVKASTIDSAAMLKYINLSGYRVAH